MDLLTILSDLIWGLPTVILILGVGLAYTAALKLPQIGRIKQMLLSCKDDSPAISCEKPLSPIQSLSTSLAATVGTGSVIGVATALTLGGAGAVFWMWVSAFFGMAVAYAEGVLSIKYRRTLPDGSRTGGIWYALRDGLGAHKTACAYAVFCVLASFGMGSMAQTNSAATALLEEFSLPPAICGGAVALLLGLCLFKSQKFCGRLCQMLVPPLAGLYVIGALAIIIANFGELPSAFKMIFSSAFGFKPIAGGAIGYTVKTAMSVGCRRGVFSNEAGLGTTAPVHAASSVDDPNRQGLMNMLEVMIDTFVICTLTALAILCSGAYPSGADGAELIIKSAENVFGGLSGKLVSLSIAGFSLATAVGWSQIGLAAAKYLLPKQRTAYKMMFILSAFLGTVMSLEAVWKLSDIFNGLMVIPCMTALILLFGEVINEAKFSAKMGAQAVFCEAKPRTEVREVAPSDANESTGGAN